MENAANEGWYIYPKGAPMFVDGSENQFNHYLSLGKTYVELSQISGPHQAEALNKATRMANRYKNDLTWDDVKDAYSWSYYPKQSATYIGWDERTSTTINHENNACWTADHDINKIPYAAIELDFAVLAYDNGIVFDEKDMQRFVHTFTRNVLTYDGSGMPKLNFAVDGSGGIAPPIQEVFATQWMKTAPWDDTIFHMNRKLYASHATVVSLAHLAHFNEFARIAATKGTVWTWGNNVYGQLGDGTTVNRSVPVLVNAMTDMISVKSGHYHSLALKSDGTVWSWGFNNSGQLGDGTTVNRSNPVQVSGLSNVVAIAAGGYHSLALKSDGTLWTWGSNTAGQLGDNTTANRLTPVQVTSMSDITAIDASVGHSMALKKDGTVWTWGYNNSGQLGDGTTTNRSIPVQAAGLNKVTAIAAGGYHSVALKTNGTVFAWGANDKGQLGDGTNTGRTTPVQVSNLTDVKTIGAGLYHSAAAKYNGGSLWTWGDNSFGQLGDGTTANHNAPVQAAGINGIMRVEGGAYSTTAFQFAR